MLTLVRLSTCSYYNRTTETNTGDF